MHIPRQEVSQSRRMEGMKSRKLNITFLKRKMNHKKVRIGVIVLILVLAAVSVGRFVFRRKGPGNLSAQLSVQSAVAETGNISSTISGTGTLEGEDAENVTVPEGIVVREILVNAGEKVKKGQKLATVDRASVAKVLLEVENDLDEVEDDIDDLSDDADEEGTEEYLETIVLRSERSDLKETKEELETLLDTKTITADRAGIVGEIFVAEDEEAGSSSSSEATSTSSGSSGAAVTMLSADSTAVRGSLLSTAKTSQIRAVSLSAVRSSDADAAKIENCVINVDKPKTGDAPQSEIAKTEQYTGTITWNPADVTFQPGTAYTAVIVLQVEEGYVFTADTGAAVSGALSVGKDLNADGSTLTLKAAFAATEEASTENTEEEETTETTENTGSVSESTGTTSGAATESGGSESTTAAATTESGDGNTTSGAAEGNGASTEKAPDTQAGSKKNQQAGKNDLPSSQKAGTGSSMPSGGSVSSGAASSQSTAASSTSSESSADETAVLSIVSEEKVIVSINVDELDILSVKEGQSAEITLDAVEDEIFEGTISAVSAVAAGNTGSAVYPVEIVLDKTADMLYGMSASATIQVEEANNAILIPVNALQEEGDTTFVYTEKDAEGNLSGKTEVTTGLSDGTQVAIVSGLEEGDTVYYLRTGTDSDDSTFPDMGGGMPAGDMPEDMPTNMPSGGDFGGGRGGGFGGSGSR